MFGGAAWCGLACSSCGVSFFPCPFLVVVLSVHLVVCLSIDLSIYRSIYLALLDISLRQDTSRFFFCLAYTFFHFVYTDFFPRAYSRIDIYLYLV